MKAAVLGAGFISGFHIKGYQRLKDVTLAAVCDTDMAKAEKAAAAADCACYTDAKEMLLREKPDLISICLPTHLHRSYTEMALNAGAHVLCEKPMALTGEDCRAMTAAARKYERVLMVGQVLRWWPEYAAIHRICERLGPPKHILTERLQHASRGGWFLEPDQGGGALYDLFVHDLDFVRTLFKEEPEAAFARGRRGNEGSWRQVDACLTWPGGSYALLCASNIMPAGFPFTASFHARWDNATLDYTFRVPKNIGTFVKADAAFTLIENGEKHTLPVDPDAQNKAFNAEIESFVRSTYTGESALPPEDSLRTMALLSSVRSRLEG